MQQHPKQNVKVRAVLALLAMAAVIGAIAFLAVNDHRSAAHGVVAAFESQTYRSVEGRLTGGFAYRPLPPVTRGARVPRPEIVAYGTPLIPPRDAGYARHSVLALQQRGISYLLTGQWEEAVGVLDEALRVDTQFEDRAAAIAASNEAALLSDVAAGHHAYARHRREPRFYVIAAEAAQRAWAIRKTPETAWNRAITIESLHLRESANAAWSDYLSIDSDSQWAGEVRERMRALAQPTVAVQGRLDEHRLAGAVASGDRAEILRMVRAFPFEARMLAEHTYLLQWAETSPVLTEESARRLDFCRAIGRALQRSSGESLLADTVADIDRASPSRRADIRNGLLIYADARGLYTAGSLGQADDRFRAAYEALTRAGNPFAEVARMCIAKSGQFLNDRRVMEDSDAWLTSGSLDERRHPSVAAQLHWVRGHSNLRIGRPQASIDEYERALAFFEQLGERNNVASVHDTLSEAYDYVGSAAAAWKHRLTSLEMRAQNGDQRDQLRETLRMSAAAALREQLPSVAIVFLDAQLAACDEASLMRYAALMSRARAHRMRGNEASAAADMGEAQTLLPKIRGPAVRVLSRNDPEVRERRTAIVKPGERRKALHGPIIHFADHGLGIPLAELDSELGRELIRSNQRERSEATLFSAIDQLEKERDTIEDAEQRGSFLAARRSLYDALVTLLCERGDFRRAFEVVERSRARVLLDSVSSDPQPLTLDRIQAALDADTAIVEYASVGKSGGAWVVSRHTVQFFPIDGADEDRRRLVDRFRIAMRDRDDAAAMNVSRELYDVLIRPWYSVAHGYERLVFVPGRVLSALPFAALHDGESFLIDRHIVSSVPSANLLAACFEQDRTRAPARETALIVAPATGVGTGDGSLAATRAEVADLESRYPTAMILEGRRATRREFVELAPFAAIIHFAGHATPERADVPRLVFTPEAEDADGLMHAEDIAALRLPATRVVMLAACNSGRERSAIDVDGVSSLARAFLAAGVPIVIGSHWEVDDAMTAQLSRRFHSFLGRGQDPAQALRSAQLQMRASRDANSGRLSAWAAFAAIGGTQRQVARY